MISPSRFSCPLVRPAVRFVLAALLAFGPCASAQNAPSNSVEVTSAPLAGTAIRNRAYVTFDVGEQPVRIDSNEVSVNVAGVPGVSLTPSIERRVTAGASVALAHRLTNTGNVASIYRVQWQTQNGDYELGDAQIGRDLNGNGQLDAGEPVLGAGETIALQPGEHADLVLQGRVPATIAPGAASRTHMTASVVGFDAATAQITDALNSVAGAAVSLRKSASTAQSARGETIAFSITAQNSGTLSPAPQNVTLDGTLRALLLLRDQIPANTVLLELSNAPVGATRMYHIAGAASDRYVSAPPSDLEQVDAVALGLSALEANASATLLFKVRVGATASAQLSNVAHFLSLDPATNGAADVPSNEVLVALPKLPPVLNYYTGASYATLAGVTTMNRPLFLQGSAAAANHDAGRIETVQLTVRSRLTGDTITVTAVETGPNTGLFRVQNPIPTSEGAADAADGKLQIRANDQLEAALDDGSGARAIANILVDPFGVVFDSRTNAPVAGARVTLIDVTGSGNGGAANAPARVFDVDGTTPLPSTVTTPADGTFRFPLVAGGTYRLEVAPPANYSFPSKVSVFLLPSARRLDASGSFGGAFRLDVVTGALQIDVPLDAPPPTGLFLEKTASRFNAELADFVDYQLRLRNTTGTLLSGLSLTDTLPRGFALVSGSVRSGGATIADPSGAPGPTLRFSFADLLPDAEITLTYRVRIGAGAQSGDAINRAQANATTPQGAVASNTASAKVRVSAGLLTERAILFGKVFVDANRNRIEDKGEPGVPGARVWIEDGTYAVTDSDGKYSLYGLSARTHIVKLDRVTLPQGAQLEPLTARHGGRGDSAFADLQRGELHKVNFALVDATPALLAQIEKRRAAGDPFAAEVTASLQGDLRSSTNDVLPDARTLPSSGTMSATGPVAAGDAFSSLNPDGNLNTSPNGSNAGTFSAAGNVFVPGSRLNQNNSNLSRPDELVPFTAQNSAVTNPNDATTNPNSAVTNPNDATANPNSAITNSNGAVANPNSAITNPNDAVTNPNGATASVNAASGIGNAARESAPIPAGEAGAAQFEAYLAGADNSFAVLTPSENAALPLDQVNVRVKGVEGATFHLRVNGQEVPLDRIGARLNDPARALQALEYVGVQLRAGANTLIATQTDPFGNERGRVERHISAPGRAARLLLDAPSGGQSADGVTPVILTLRVTDEKGLPVTSRTPVTLETASGRFDLDDLNPREPGTQVFVEGGVLRLRLLPPSEPGDGLVRALSGPLEARRVLSFVPELRPLVVLGTLEGGVNFVNFRPQGVSGDEFSDALPSLGGSDKVGARAALFLKGRVLGRNLLTLRFDSQSTRDRLFRDIQPDEYYPVYGDGALKGFDAQSTGRLYVRLDRARNSFLYGDFSTANSSQINSLGNYQRALNGARQHLENGRYQVDLFAARDSGTQLSDELRANGTSGGYALRAGDLVANSERVEIITRDRNNLGVILEVQAQTRFRDYEFDYLTGRLLFRAPVPSYDANFNPRFVRVFYQVENNGPGYWVSGAQGAVKITPNLQVGGSLVRDSNPQDGLELRALNATYQAGAKTTVSAEVARSQRDSLGAGNGSRLEVLHDGARLQARLFAGQTGRNFDNPGSILSGGRSELSLRAAWRLNARTRVLAEALRTSDRSLGGARMGASASIEREFAGGLRAEVGLRHAKEDGAVTLGSANGKVDFTSLRSRLTVPVGEKASAFGEYEFDLRDPSQRVLAAGGDYRLGDRSRLYARHEFISALDGRYALNGTQEQQNTVFGVDTSYSQSGHLFSEYRLNGALSGREGQAAIGVRDGWDVADGVRVTGGFERTKSLGQNLSGAANDSTALTGGVEYTRSENLKATSRLELRQSASSHSLLGTIGVAGRLNREVTLLGRGVFNVQQGRDGTADTAQNRVQLGLSYRDRDDDKWSGLAKYEWRQTRNGTAQGALLPSDGVLSGAAGGSVHLFSLDANYQANARFTLSGHLGAKFNADRSNGLSSRTSAELIGGRAIYDLNRKTEASAQVAALFSRGGAVQYGWGAELGRLVGRDLWLSGGYNLGAVSDGDLTGSGFSRRGPYLRVRFKFDESLLGGREAQLLAQTQRTQTPGEQIQSEQTLDAPLAGTHLVSVPVVGVDPETQRRAALPMSAEIEVAAGAEAPQHLEIDIPMTQPQVMIMASARLAPPALNPRIVAASGQWNITLDASTLAQNEAAFFVRQAQERRAAALKAQSKAHRGAR